MDDKINDLSPDTDPVVVYKASVTEENVNEIVSAVMGAVTALNVNCFNADYVPVMSVEVYVKNLLPYWPNFKNIIMNRLGNLYTSLDESVEFTNSQLADVPEHLVPKSQYGVVNRLSATTVAALMEQEPK